jgi:hypothetical protein
MHRLRLAAHSRVGEVLTKLDGCICDPWTGILMKTLFAASESQQFDKNVVCIFDVLTNEQYLRIFCIFDVLTNEQYLRICIDSSPIIGISSNRACVSNCRICKWPIPFVFNPAKNLKLKI